jgi:hypothetical protein
MLNNAPKSLTIPYAVETACVAFQFDYHLMLMPPALFTLPFLFLVTMPSMTTASHSRGMHPDEENKYGNPKPVIL